MIRVLLADDHTLFRKGVAELITTAPDMEVVGEASDGEEVLDLVHHTPCDVLLLDISMPGEHGLGVLAKVQTSLPHLPVLFVSMHPEEEYAVRVLRLGAAGYISKESNPADLLQAIRRVYGGHKYISPISAEQLVQHYTHPKGMLQSHEELSDREFQVMRLLVAGESHTEIADALDINPKTVSTYKGRILTKMALENIPQLVQYAMRHDLL